MKKILVSFLLLLLSNQMVYSEEIKIIKEQDMLIFFMAQCIETHPNKEKIDKTGIVLECENNKVYSKFDEHLREDYSAIVQLTLADNTLTPERISIIEHNYGEAIFLEIQHSYSQAAKDIQYKIYFYDFIKNKFIGKADGLMIGDI